MSQSLATTKMSSRGQVVIPLAVRSRMGLKEGAEFVVVDQGDSLMLKVISPPSLDEFRALQKQLQRQTKRAGLKRRDVEAAVRKVRGRR